MTAQGDYHQIALLCSIKILKELYNAWHIHSLMGKLMAYAADMHISETGLPGQSAPEGFSAIQTHTPQTHMHELHVLQLLIHLSFNLALVNKISLHFRDVLVVGFGQNIFSVTKFNLDCAWCRKSSVALSVPK